MPEPDKSVSARSVVVCTVADIIEAQLATDALRAADIPCAVEEHELKSVWDGIVVSPQGWGSLRVAERDQARALEIVTAVLAKTDVSEEELEREAEEGATPPQDLPDEPEQRA